MKIDQNQILSGPSRVFPGRLSVCRSFGDVEAKSEKHGGNPKVLIAEPEVYIIKLSEEHDYILMGCDGIFDQISNNELVEAIGLTFEKLQKDSTLHTQSGLAVDMIMKTALSRRALDNITSVFIGFENWERRILSLLSGCTEERKVMRKNSKSLTINKEKEQFVNKSINMSANQAKVDNNGFTSSNAFRSSSFSKSKANKVFSN